MLEDVEGNLEEYKKAIELRKEWQWPEIEENQNEPEEKEEIEEPKNETKQPAQKRKNIFDDLNNSAKKNKW